VREAAQVALWFVVALVVADIVLGLAFAFPQDGDGRGASALANYLDYGRSIEGKIRRMVGPTDAQTAAMARAGWLGDHDDLPAHPAHAGPLVAVYGMSFAARVADELVALDPSVTIRMVGGPGAPLNHSYAAWERDRDAHDAAVVVLGVLASSLPRTLSLTHMTANFEAPSPHSYPRFDWKQGRIERTEPRIATLPQLRAALAGATAADRQAWEAWKRQLAGHDAFYDRFVFEANASDHSVIVRLIRRAWGQHVFQATVAATHDAEGFRDDLGVVRSARALLRDFAQRVRARGRLPIVLLFEDRGYADHLSRALAPTLDAADVRYVATGRIAPATQLGNFLADGHFRPEIDQRIAQQVLETIREELPAD